MALRPQNLVAQLEEVLSETAELNRQLFVILNTPHRVDLPDLGQTILRPGLNLGYGGGLQFARRFYDSEFVWIVQDDMEIQPGALETLIWELENDEDLAAVSPAKIRKDGLLHPGGAGGTLDAELRWERAFPESAMPLAEYEYEGLQTHIPGGGMLIRTSVLDNVGGFDPRFFPKQKVDVDLCLRLGKKGHRFKVTPATWIIQNQGQTVSDRVTSFLQEHHRKTLLAKHSDLKDSDFEQVTSDQDLIFIVANSAGTAFLDYTRHIEQTLTTLSEKLESFSLRDSRRKILRQRLSSATPQFIRRLFRAAKLRPVPKD